MHEVKRKRALPVYIAAAVFALYALLLPLYSLFHFFIAALVTAAAWLLADKLLGTVTEYEADEGTAPADISAPAEAGAFSAADAMTVNTEVRVMERIMNADGLGAEDEITKAAGAAQDTPPQADTAARDARRAEYSAAEAAMLRTAQEINSQEQNERTDKNG